MIIKKLLLGCFAGTAAMSFGQFESVPGADYMPALFLNPAVAKDMHLSPDLVSKEQGILIQEGMALMPYLSKSKQASSPSQKKQLQAEMLKAFHHMETASLAPLNSAQRVRYHQLSLQYFGPMALAQPKQAAALHITSAQNSKLLQMLSSTSAGMAKSASNFHGSRGDLQGTMGAMNAYQTTTRVAQESALKRILTPAQISQWNAMQGRKLPNVSNLFGGFGGS